MNRSSPSASEVLTQVDVDELPNGTASIFRVADDDRMVIYTATIDDQGYVRALNVDRNYFPRERFEVLDESSE